MKTNKITKILFAFMAVIILSLLTVTANAETAAVSTSTDSDVKQEKKETGRHPKKYDDDWFEDWFEDRIEKFSKGADFSELPENASEEEIVEFFKKYFAGDRTALEKPEKPERSGKKNPDGKNGEKPFSGSEKKGKNRSERHVKHNDRAEWLEDWFEDRIDARKHSVDFNELPENPTDDEVLEFFKNNFMNENPAQVNDVQEDEVQPVEETPVTEEHEDSGKDNA